MMQFGLSAEALKALCAIFLKFDKIDQVKIFGSRALGSYRAGSDIDLALEGRSIELNDLLDVRVKLDNLILPYRFDLVDYRSLADNDPLKEHIDRVGKVIFTRDLDSMSFYQRKLS